MAKAQLDKLLADLNSNNDKLKILALMYIPRIKDRRLFELEEMSQLIQIVSECAESPNTDISFLARKAKNYLGTYAPSEPRGSDQESGKAAAKSQTNPWSGLNAIDIQKRLNLFKPGNSKLEEISVLLRHDNLRVVASAIETIERLGSEEDIVNHLVPFTYHENNRVRANALKAVGKIHMEKVKEPLAEMLQSHKIALRESAVWTITQLEPTLYLKDALLKRLHDPYRDIRLRAIEALIKYPYPDVITQMRRLSNDLDPDIRDSASRVMQDLISRLQPGQMSYEGTPPSSDEEESYDEFIDETPSYISIDSTAKESIDIEEDYLETKPNDTNSQPLPELKDPSPVMTSKSEIKLLQTDITPFEQLSQYKQKVLVAKKAPKTNQNQKIHDQIKHLLRTVGQQAFALCQEYDPGNRHVERASEMVQKAQSRLLKYQQSEPVTKDQLHRLTELQNHLRETLIDLGKTAMREANRTEFNLHGIPEYQEKLRRLLTMVNKS